MAKYDEQKVSITLSNEAHNTISSDMRIFLLKENWAGFINTILGNYKDESSASIKLATERERNRIFHLISTGKRNPSETENAIVKKLITHYTQQLREEMHSFSSDSGVTKKIRICDQNFEDLALDGESDYFSNNDYRQAGLYVKAILEDYARQPFSKREEIYFCPILSEISRAIDKHCLVKINYTDRNGEKFTFKLQPYGVVTDSTNHYHYFIGIPYGEQNALKSLYTLRISRMISVKALTSYTAHLSKNEQRIIKEQIATKGVSYLQGSEEICRVELTEHGRNLYNTILHLRPRYINTPEPDSNGHAIYEFSCTQEQIRNYFIRFGKDAIILSPDTLKKEFADWYKEAAKNYKQ